METKLLKRSILLPSLFIDENIRALDLSNNNIAVRCSNDNGSDKAQSSVLEILDMSRNNISDFSGIRFICKLPKLRKLYLSYNKISSTLAFASLTLQVLDISFNRMRENNDITSVLENCPSLLVLRANCVCMAEKNGLLLASHLQSNTTQLASLSVRFNALGDSVAEAFAQTILVNTSLRVLNIDRNGFSYQGWRQLYKAVKSSSLRTRLVRVGTSDKRVRPKESIGNYCEKIQDIMKIKRL